MTWSVRPDGLALLSLDDGKMNALDASCFRAIEAGFSQCTPDVSTFVVTGRTGVLSAGLDREVLARKDETEIQVLLEAFARAILRIWIEPRPVVVASTGHAIGAGAMLCLAADYTIQARGDFKIGLPETRLGFPLPRFQIEIARNRVRADYIDRLLLAGNFVDPRGALDAGIASDLEESESVLERAADRANELVSHVHDEGWNGELSSRASLAWSLLAGIGSDISEVVEVGLGPGNRHG